MAQKIMQEWSVYILGLENFSANNAQIYAPRVGVCSSYFTLGNSIIDASSRGCKSNQGMGRRPTIQGCSGSGGSHGGFGGFGLPLSIQGSIETCSEEVSEPYYFGQEARYEGSGGSSEQFTGGAGGGIIWLTCPNLIYA